MKEEYVTIVEIAEGHVVYMLTLASSCLVFPAQRNAQGRLIYT